MRFACWLTKAKNTLSEYVTLTAFLWQQWVRERASMLRVVRMIDYLVLTQSTK
jgi:hypothetical protein